MLGYISLAVGYIVGKAIMKGTRGIGSRRYQIAAVALTHAAVVAAGASYRLFTKDFPREPSRSTTAYFAAVMAALGLVLYFTPGQGFGRP
jgi:hypothetical protein